MRTIHNDSILIKGGRVINPAKFDKVCDVLIVNGRVAEIGEDIKDADYVIKAEGKIVSPSFIDMHAHLREPGQEYKEDFESGSLAAIAGGYGTVATMANTEPVVDNAYMVERQIKRAEQVGLIDIKIIGAVSKNLAGLELAEINSMIRAGAIAFSDDGHYIDSARLMRNAVEYLKRSDKLIICHEEESQLVEGGAINEGIVSAKYGISPRPALAEEIAVARDIEIARSTGGRIHIAHISSRRSVELVRRAKAEGIRISCEVTPHHISLTENDIDIADAVSKVNPPLRTVADVESCIAGLADDTIDIIVTDHSPHAVEEKDCEYAKAKSGFVGLETAYGVVISELYHKRGFSLEKVLSKITTEPARLYGLDCGLIETGKPARITINDINKKWLVNGKQFYSKSKLTPYEGRELTGQSEIVIVRDNIYLPKS